VRNLEPVLVGLGQHLRYGMANDIGVFHGCNHDDSGNNSQEKSSDQSARKLETRVNNSDIYMVLHDPAMGYAHSRHMDCYPRF